MTVTEPITAEPEAGYGRTMASTDQYGVSRPRMLLWQTEGHVDPSAQTASDILESAGLDWDVEMLPLKVAGVDGGPDIVDTKRRAIVRADTHQILGVAKSRYVPHSNAEVLSFLDNIVEATGASYEAAWSWRGGESVGVTMRLPDEVTIAGFDTYAAYILARTSHDGGGAVLVAPTMVRLACTNMANIAIKGAIRQFRATHTKSLEGRIAEARHALDVTFEYGSALDDELKRMLEMPVSKDKVARTAKELFGEKHTETAVEFWMTAPNIADFRNTRYGAFNAMTEYAQWERPRNPHLESVVRGPIARTTDKAYQILAESPR